MPGWHGRNTKHAGGSVRGQTLIGTKLANGVEFSAKDVFVV